MVVQEPGQVRTCSSVGSHRFEARPGHHLAPATLASGRNVFEALGPGYTLLAFGADPEAVHAFEQAPEALSVPLAVVTDPGRGEAARYDAGLVLVRPDQFVAWVGGRGMLTPDDATQVLLRAGGASAPAMASHP